jgi:hypothetical protein
MVSVVAYPQVAHQGRRCIVYPTRPFSAPADNMKCEAGEDERGCCRGGVSTEG